MVPTASLSGAQHCIELVRDGATYYHEQLGLPDKGHAINGLVAWKAFYHLFDDSVTNLY